MGILKSSRIERMMPTITIILLPIAISSSINLNVVLLIICCLLIYSAASIHNGMKDNDLDLPKNSKYLVLFFLITAAILSFFDPIILITSISWVILGYLYNSHSRKVLFGDSSILAFTHYVLPFIASSLLISLSSSLIITISIVIYLVMWPIMNVKNVKDWRDDKERGYRTIMTNFKNGYSLCLVCIQATVILMFISYLYIFGNELSYFFSLMVLTIDLFIISDFKRGNHLSSMEKMRSLFMIYILGLISPFLGNSNLIWIYSSPLLFYNFFQYFVNDFKPNINIFGGRLI